MHFTWIGDSYELMRFRRFLFLKHKVCIIKAVRFVMAESDDGLSDEDESDEEEEIAHSVPFKCISCS